MVQRVAALARHPERGWLCQTRGLPEAGLFQAVSMIAEGKNLDPNRSVLLPEKRGIFHE
jgi:hypothetical protein